MKRLFYCILASVFFVAASFGATTWKGGISATGNTLKVTARPSATASGNYSAGNVSIRWKSSLGAGVDLTNLVPIKGSWLVDQVRTVSGIYYYVNFAFVAGSPLALSGTADVDLFTVDVTGGTGTSAAEVFEMAPVGFSLDWFFEVGGADATDAVFFQSSVANVTLPVELVGLTANARGRNIELSWATKTEINNYGFDVERMAASKDAKWEKISFVEGKGTTNAPQNYSYKDVVKSAGTFTYRLKQTDRDGKFTYSAQVEAKAALTADDYKMSQNYPNPFNPSTKFNFAVSTPQHVSVKVFNSVGQEVQTLFNDIAPADQMQEVTFDGARLASGIYFYVLRAQDRVEVKKMLMMK